jgi:hypothetical protein
MPTFGSLTVPIAPRVPSTFIGILGHKLGCLQGPFVMGNARLDTSLSHAEFGFGWNQTQARGWAQYEQMVGSHLVSLWSKRFALREY